MQNAAPSESARPGPLERATREWRGTFDAIEWPIVIVDGALRVRRLNQATLRSLGGTYASWLGGSFSSLGAREPWLGALALLERVLSTGKPDAVQVEDASTKQTWEVSARIVDAGGEAADLAMIIIRDTSRETRLAQSLRHSETMAAMGSLLASVVHEVRNPLFAISSILDAWAVRGVEADAPAYQAVLRKEVNRLRHMMEELLEYGRPYTSDLRPGELSEVISEASAACAPLAEQQQVAVRAAVPRSTVLMDRARLVRVFVNLIQNAIQHAPAGSGVLVEAREDDTEANPTLQVTVRDQGPGFAEEDLPMVFSPFFSRRRGGTGLGLAIVRRIIDEHHGLVGVENHPEGGAVVRLTLQSVPRGNQ